MAILVMLTTSAPAAIDPATSLMNEIFQDHAVLQQGRPIRVWGNAHPGEEVSVSLSAHTVRVRVDPSGRWLAELPALEAGGPFTLSASAQSGATQLLSDILIGDVWLCSGQSNMELPVSATLNAAREISQSADNNLRLFTVTHASIPSPQTHLKGNATWAAARPDTVRDFSAACFYFARELQKTHPIPMGLIHASWGGSRIEPWISEMGLRQTHGFEQRLDLLSAYADDSSKGDKLFGSLWQSWWQSRTGSKSKPWTEVSGGDWQPMPEPMRDWKTWGVPKLASHDGMVWFRRSITLTAAQAAGASSLSLGAIDEVDITWVNGIPIGNSFGYATERTYALPAGALHAGDNLLVVNVLSTWDAGGMYGPLDHMALKTHDGDIIPLGGRWQYQFVPESLGFPPRAPWESVSGLTTLYNGMIAPIQHYSLRGILWYQGESNAGEADRYQELLSDLMSDWRRSFGVDTPFLIVQLPNFGSRTSAPAASAWANLREAQRRAVAADPQAALAVSIDVGEPRELHPPNKQAVGERLARAARSLVYHEPVSPSGPIPLRVERLGGKIVATFAGTENSLLAYSALRPIGFELCDNAASQCRYVEASLESNRVMIDAEGSATKQRLRYCWGDAPICNLYDTSGLPAGPFDIAIQ
jgi:sialate O-acetylesterase